MAKQTKKVTDNQIALDLSKPETKVELQDTSVNTAEKPIVLLPSRLLKTQKQKQKRQK